MPEFIDNPYDGDPEILQWTQDTLDPALVEIARTEWFPPGSSESPGSQEGGSGEPSIPGDNAIIGDGDSFIESMTTNYHRNKGCTANAMAMINAQRHCKELQKHRDFKGKSCKQIAMDLAKELYKLYNDRKYGYSDSAKRAFGLPRQGTTRRNQMKLLRTQKIRQMWKYGIKLKPPRIFGHTPSPGRFPVALFNDDIPPEENYTLPPATKAWVDAQPWGGRGGGPLAGTPPPPNNPFDVSSACCPPEGCDVTVVFHGSRGGHKVAGQIIKCDPLTIRCMEHPLQGTDASYNLIAGPPAYLQGILGQANISRMAHISHATGTHVWSGSSFVNLEGAVRTVDYIVCFCD